MMSMKSGELNIWSHRPTMMIRWSLCAQYCYLFSAFRKWGVAGVETFNF